jgi:lipid A 3-O-deacylase
MVAYSFLAYPDMNKFVFPAACALAALLAFPAQAQDLKPSSMFLQGGVGRNGLSSATIGLNWPWAWKNKSWGGEFSVQTEAYASFWHAKAFGGGHQGFTQIALVPMLRYRLDNGASPWFVEGGIGISTTDRLYVTPNKTFSTRFNFSDNIAVGRSFGAQNKHEVSLRLQHTSNASIKQPNPGEEFLQLRYGFAF